jgi:phosphomannomutase
MALRNYAATRLHDLEVRAGGTASVDVTNARVDKACGMRRLMSILDLTNADVLFLGDKLDEGATTTRSSSWESTP